MREAGGRIVLVDFGSARRSGQIWPATVGHPLFVAAGVPRRKHRRPRRRSVCAGYPAVPAHNRPLSPPGGDGGGAPPRTSPWASRLAPGAAARLSGSVCAGRGARHRGRPGRRFHTVANSRRRSWPRRPSDRAGSGWRRPVLLVLAPWRSWRCLGVGNRTAQRPARSHPPPPAAGGPDGRNGLRPGESDRVPLSARDPRWCRDRAAPRRERSG